MLVLLRLRWHQPHLIEKAVSTRWLPSPRLHTGENQPILGARHPDVEQAARLLDLALTHVALARKLFVFRAHDVDAREFEALGRVEREKIHTHRVTLDSI